MQTAVVVLQGEYDASRRDELDAELDRFGDAEPLAIDAHAVESLDTSALRSLVRFQRARAAAGKSPAVLLRPSAEMQHFLTVAEVNSAFEIRDRI